VSLAVSFAAVDGRGSEISPGGSFSIAGGVEQQTGNEAEGGGADCLAERVALSGVLFTRPICCPLGTALRRSVARCSLSVTLS
jgi:hypothetical protein